MGDLDIDQLIGATTVVAQPKAVQSEDTSWLARRLTLWSEGCRDVFVDLRTVGFGSDDGGMYLTLPEGSSLRRLDFKRDPSNPKDPKIVHAQKQLCKMLGVPHTFFMSNRPIMRESIFKSWQSGLETDDKKARCVARIKEGSDVSMIRAILPERAVPPRAADVVVAIAESFGSSARLLFSHGDDCDDLVLHARFVFDDKVPFDGGEMLMGFDLVFSELGAHPMTVDSLVHDVTHAVSYIASYGGEPYFSSKYEGLQPKEVSEMLPGLLTRMRAEAQEFGVALKSASENGVYSIRQDCVSITRARGINGGMRKAVFHEATQSNDISSRLDLARHVAQVAKDFDSLKGLALERAAGHYINLCFARSPDVEQQEGGENG